MPEPLLPAPVLPDYGGACIDGVVPALMGRADGPPPAWLPAEAAGADQVVLLVLDGLGWLQLGERASLAPTLSAMSGGPITSVAPSTTAVALTSITTGRPPAGHGVVGYRVRVGDRDVLNVLKWRTSAGDAREAVPPTEFITALPFGSGATPVVTRAEFAGTGFSLAHLAGTRFCRYRVTSTLVVEVGRLLGEGEPFVYAYYDGIDNVAHEYGFDGHYEAELRAVDRLIDDLLEVLPTGACLVVTADHGQVEVGRAVVPVHREVADGVAMSSGEARFRWLHAKDDSPEGIDRLATLARSHHADSGWVATLGELEAASWFGGPLSPALRRRLGDVALVASEPVAFVDVEDTGDVRLICRHGSLTEAEMLVPLLAVRA